MNPLNLVRPFGVVLAGVSMQGRQEAVNQAKIGDKAFGRREGATHKHSHANAIVVVDSQGRQLGYIPRAYADRLVASYGPNIVLRGKVKAVRSGETTGLEIEWQPPTTQQDSQDRAEAGRSEAGPGDTQDTQHAYSKAGRDLGQVIDSDATHVKVRRSDGLEVRFPKATITLG